jgi:uncharacterized protein YgiM (DUF1202 family)
MSEYEGPGSDILMRIGRGVVPVVALIIVVMATLVIFAQYRDAVSKTDSPARATETTPSVEPTDTPDGVGTDPDAGTGEPSNAVGAPYVLVLADNLNMRSNPITSSDVIKRLKKDEQLALLEKTSGWYRVRDAAGDEGWVAAGGNYTKLIEP